MVKICGIYKIVNPVGKCYIGQSWNIYQRWRRYKTSSFIKNNGQTKLINSLLKYGWRNHIFQVIYECDPKTITQEELNELEIKYIDYYNALNPNEGLNIRFGGSNGRLSLETIEKMKNRVISQETREKLSRSLKGKTPWNKGMPRSEKVKNKISIANKGKVSARKGVFLSDETKQKLRIANLGKIIPLEIRKKLGTPKTEKQKQNLSIKNKGENNPFYNKTHSDEIRRKISDAVKKARAREKANGIYINQIKIQKINPNNNQIVQTYNSLTEAAIENNISISIIDQVINHRIITLKNGAKIIRFVSCGYKWKKTGTHG